MLIPPEIRNETELDAVLTQPGPELIEQIRSFSSPLLILGAGGKMGPTLAVMARRAAEAAGHSLEVIAVSRFNDRSAREWLEERRVRTVACDLLDRDAVAQLPDCENLVYLVGLKFGTSSDPSTTWAINTVVPANVAQRFPKARIVALSTGNVYPRSPNNGPGSTEDSPLTPLGEYPNAAVARERIFEFYSRRNRTPLTLLRLFYAVELRYGIVSELARSIVNATPIDLRAGSFNCIWQRDANDMILRSLRLASTPPAIYNLSQCEAFPVRNISVELGERLGAAPLFQGTEAETALLGSCTRLSEALGMPATPMHKILDWTADWVKNGGRDLGKPTHFEVRDGVY
jgi:nucleoside-diphosphate-sugar epimerase